MTDFDPWNAANTQPGIDPASPRKLYSPQEFADFQDEYIDIEQMRRSIIKTEQMSWNLPNVTGISPELAAAAGFDHAQTGYDAVTQFDGLETEFSLEQQLKNWEYVQATTDNYEVLADEWNHISPVVQQALIQRGANPPVENNPGGIDIPFTSGIRGLLGMIPGSPVDGGGGDFQLLAGRDNFATSILDNIGEGIQTGVSTPISAGLKAFEWGEQHLVTRPMTVGQLYREENPDKFEMIDPEGNPIQSQGLIPDWFGKWDGFIGAVFDGDVGRLYNQTQDSRGTYRPAALDRASQILDGDEVQLMLAVEMERNGGDPAAAAQAISGQPLTAPSTQAITNLLWTELMPEEGEINEFMEARLALRYQKADYKHALAEQAGIAQDDAWHGVYAGTVELTTLLIMDPTMVGGKLNKLRKIAKGSVLAGNVGAELARMEELTALGRVLAKAPPAGTTDEAAWWAQRAEDARRFEVPADPEHVIQPQTINRLVQQADTIVTPNIRDGVWAKLVTSSDQQIAMANRVDGVMQRISRAADEADEYTLLDLRKEVAATSHMMSQLRDGIRTGQITSDPKTAWAFMQDATGRQALSTGALGRNANIVRLPQLTRGSQRRARLNTWWDESFDMSKRLPPQARQAIEQASEAWRGNRITTGKFNEAVRNYVDERSVMARAWQSKLGLRTIVARTTKHVPRENYISLGGKGSVVAQHDQFNKGLDEFERFLNMGDVVNMSPADRSYYMNAFMEANVGERMEVVKAAVGEMAIRSGIFNDADEAAELLAKYNLGLDNHFHSMSKEGIDIFGTTRSSISDHTAVWSRGIKNQVAIPDFRDLQRAARKANNLRAFAGDKIAAADTLLSRFWKPWVILRVGFITRAAGEESLSFILNHGSRAYMNAQFGRRWSATQVMDPATGQLLPSEQLTPAFRRLRATGQQVKKWTKTRDEDLIGIGARRAAGSAQEAGQDLYSLDRQIRTAANRAEKEALVTKFNELEFKYWSDELNNRGFVNQRLMDLSDMAMNFAIDASPRVWNMFRKAHLPSRRGIAAAFGGTTRRMVEGDARPFGARPVDMSGKNHFNDIRTGVDPENLVLAHHLALSNDSVQRAMTDALGSSWGEYGRAGELDRLNPLDNHRLTSQVIWEEKTTWYGRQKMIPMSKPSTSWRLVEANEQEARSALGFALNAIADDPVMANSGALHALHNTIGPQEADELIEMFGEDYMARLDAITNKVADEIEAYRKTIPADWSLADQKSGKWTTATGGNPEAFYWKPEDDLSYMLHDALINGGDWPEHAIVYEFADAPARIKNLVYPDLELLREPFRAYNDGLTEVAARMDRFQNLPGYQNDLQALIKLQERNGVQVVQPLVEGATRLYTPTIRPRLTQLVRHMTPEQRKQVAEQITQALSSRGVPPAQIDRITNLRLTELDTVDQWFDELEPLAAVVEDDFIPVSDVMFSDPQLAQDVSEILDDMIRDIDVPGGTNLSGERAVEVGMFDVFDGDPVVHRGGDTWNDSTVFQIEDPGIVADVQRLDPDHQVIFMETADGAWIAEDRFNALDEIDQPALSGNVQLANGMSEWAANRELTQIRMGEINNMLIGGRTGSPLREVTGHLKAGTLEPNLHMMALPAEDFPKKVAVPEQVDVHTIMYDRVVSGLFQGGIDPAMQGIIRTPHFMHNMAANIPFMDEYYNTFTKGDVNSTVLELFEQFGMDEAHVNSFLDNLHVYLNSPTLYGDEAVTDMDGLLRLLSDPTSDSQRGAEAFHRAMVGTNDRITHQSSNTIEQLIQDFEFRYGKPPSPAQEETMNQFAEELIGNTNPYAEGNRKIYNAPVRRTRLEDTRGLMAENQELYDGLADSVDNMERGLPFLENMRDQTTRNLDKRAQYEKRILETKRDIARAEEEMAGLILRQEELGMAEQEIMASLSKLDEAFTMPRPVDNDEVRALRAELEEAREAYAGTAVLEEVPEELANLRAQMEDLFATRQNTIVQSEEYLKTSDAITRINQRQDELDWGLNDVQPGMDVGDMLSEWEELEEFRIRYIGELEEMRAQGRELSQAQGEEMVELQQKIDEFGMPNRDEAKAAFEAKKDQLADALRRRDIEDVQIQPGRTNQNGISAPVWSDLMTQSEAVRSNKIDIAVIEANWRDLQRWAQQRHQRYQEAVEMGSVRAADMTVEFIDDHRFRSQFQQTVRNIIPFWFAQEQFIKRATRMIWDSPESIRRGQLLMDYGRATGVIQTDDQGNEIVVYPGSQGANQAFLRMIGIMTGTPGLETFAEPLSHRTSQTVPGFNGGNPMEIGAGPAPAFFIAGLTNIFPELDPLSDALMMAPAQDKNILDTIFPTSFQRIAQATPGIFDSGNYATAMADAIMLGEAAGLTPPEDATPTEVEDYMNDMEMWTRITMGLSALMYLGSPIPSGNKITFEDALTDEFRQIVFDSGLPFEQGMATFMERNPDADMYSVFKTEGLTGARPASTDESLRMLLEYDTLMKDLPLAATFLLPVNTGMTDLEDWERQASQQFFERDLKRRRTPEEIREAIIITRSRNDYYDKLEVYERAIWQADRQGNDVEKKHWEEQRDLWRDPFLEQHPLFAASRGKNQERREAAKLERDKLLDMDRADLPSSRQIDLMLLLMENHRTFNNNMDMLEDPDEKHQLRMQFLGEAYQFAEAHPEVDAYYDANIRWDSDITSGRDGMIFELEELIGADL